MLIPLLQSLYDPNRRLPEHRDYEEILKDIELFDISSQVYHLLKTSEMIGQVPVFFQNALKARFIRSMGQNLLIKHKEDQLLTLLESRSLHVIPLKGVRFAETYFGHFAARVTSDIDLFVRTDQLPDAIAALETQGYVLEIIKDHHARLHHNRLMAELHWTLDMPDWSDLNAEPFWSSAVHLPPYRYVKDLSPLHTLYFICLHGARHQMDSVRYLLDVVQVLDTHAENIDYRDLMEQTEHHKTSKRIQAVLSIVYDQFPYLHDVKPLPFRSAHTPWNYSIIRSAMLGERTREYYYYKLYFRHLMFDTWKHRMKSIRKAY